MSYQVRNAKRAEQDTFESRNVTERGPCIAPNYMAVKFSTVQALRAFCEVNNIELEWADEYGEPGYGDAPKGILLTNWNRIPKSLGDRLEVQGYEMQWYDEWVIDSDNAPSKAWRGTPDSHGWEPRIRAMDGYYITPDSDAQEWIDDSLNEDSKPLPSWFDDSELERRGFGVLDQEDQQVGFHPGQNDTPDKFMPALIAEGYDVILQITDRGQFDVRYRVWTRREAKRELFLSDARGQYIPRDFAQSIDRSRITGVSMEDLDTLALGPPESLEAQEGASEHYWDIWQDICDSAVITALDGTVYRIEQNGDCWLVESAGEFCDYDDTYYTHK
jgi:hypothetical protein